MEIEDEVEDDREHAHDHNQTSHSQEREQPAAADEPAWLRRRSCAFSAGYRRARLCILTLLLVSDSDILALVLRGVRGGGCSRSPRSLASKQHGCHLVTDRHVVIV